MPTVEELRLPQTDETAATVVGSGEFYLQYAYARSADSRAGNDSGQDYLVVRQDGVRLAFALCDGVSQSFVGDLAARALGNALVTWLWQLDAGDARAQELQQACQQYLSALAPITAEQVRTYPLPPGLPPMLRDVLERKRELGSESTFSAGLLDTTAGNLLLFWMGDSRIRLWDKYAELTAKLGNTFLTQERWSTRRGPIGEVHVFVTELSGIKRIAAYSDGLAVMDQGLNDSLTVRSLNAVIAEAGNAPASDDISFLEVRFSPFAEAEAEPRRPVSMMETIRSGDTTPQPITSEAPSTPPAPVGLPEPVGLYPEAPYPAPLYPTPPISPPLHAPAAPIEQPSPAPAIIKLSKKQRRASYWLLWGAGGLALVCLVSMVIMLSAYRGDWREKRTWPFGPTFTATASPVPTHMPTPTSTTTPMLTSTPTTTQTPTATPTATATPTETLTLTPSPTATLTPNVTATAVSTETALLMLFVIP